MKDLQLVSIEHEIVTSWDFDKIKEELMRGLDGYKNLVYTDDTMKSAKSDKATLNKVKKAIEDARKAYKNECLRPYKDVEPKIKELVDLVDNQVKVIDSALTDYTERIRTEKESAVHSYYKKKSGCLGEYADEIYNKIFDSKWTNPSTSKTTYEVAVINAINRVYRDIEEIKALNSEFYAFLMSIYLTNLSLEEAMEKYKEYSAVTEVLPQRKDSATGIIADESSGIACPDNSIGNSVCIRINASEKQINRLKDYMKATGIEYEII